MSDKNRPQKIGEKFNELYDNEWTDVLDILSETMDEKVAVLKLRAVLEVISLAMHLESNRNYLLFLKNLQCIINHVCSCILNTNVYLYKYVNLFSLLSRMFYISFT